MPTLLARALWWVVLEYLGKTMEELTDADLDEFEEKGQRLSLPVPSKSGAESRGGKGSLIQEEMSATLSTSNVQTLFQPMAFKYHQGAKAGSVGAEEEVSPTLTADYHQPAVCIQGTIANGKRMGQNGLGASDDGSCYTLDTMDVHAVAYAQNQRYEVREEGGTGDLVGALPANPSGKQLQFVAYEQPVCMADDNAKAAIDENVCGTLKVGGGESVRCLPSNGEDFVGTLCASDWKGVGNQRVGEGKVIAMAYEHRDPPEYIVRRLTPTERERLQGFPDGWTDIEFKGKPASDTARYKALGNSMAVPVMRWIGERIQEYDDLRSDAE